jgi:apolipoprotein D and lipocalin family protein
MANIEYVDLPRFMGDWHVLADIPTPFDKKATQPLEHYQLKNDGTIDTTYSFVPNDGAKRRVIRAKGFVLDKNSNAVWGMQFLWPIKADYRIVYIDTEYSVAIIGRSKRDLVWIMSRAQTITDQRFAELLSIVRTLGHDLSKLRIHRQQAAANAQFYREIAS